MTPQEQEMIDGLIGRIRSTPVQNKDNEAEQHIQQGLSGYNDALYVLVQTVLVQQYGLEQAQTQLNQLKQQNSDLTSQLQSAGSTRSSSGGSFLGHLFGTDKQEAPPPARVQTQPGYQPVNNPGYGAAPSPGYGQGAAYPPPPPAYPAQGGGLFGGGGGGFMRGALQTAAGVAAGEMVFRGMEDIFGGFGGHGGGREFAGGGGETVVNNYYDDDRQSGSTDRGDDSGFYNPGRDASREDPGDGGRGFLSGGGDDDRSNDLSGFDSNDSSGDDNGDDNAGDDFGDSGSFDDSSSDDLSFS